MTETLTLAGARVALLAVARRDFAAGMDLAVPFVLSHPVEASVLSELSAIAESSVTDAERFRVGVHVLLRAVLRTERDAAAA